MKIEIPERVYFRIMQEANNQNKSVNEFVSGLFERFMNLETTYENVSQDDLELFTNELHLIIDEIIDSQEDLAKSDEGNDMDLIMVHILEIMFARATRDKLIMAECLEYFLKEKE